MSAQQQQINYGNTANDGQGDPLRTAFIKTDDNFDAIWNAGPVGSNVTILNNTVSVVNTNGNLVLSPNGVGVIQTNNSVVPRLANSYDLGTPNLRYRSAYVGSGGLSVSGNVNLQSALTANAVFTDNYFYANGAPFSGNGSSYGNANVAAFLEFYNGPFRATTISADDANISNISTDVLNTDAITNEFPINITTNGGDTWQFAGNVLRGPQGGAWQSSASTIFLNSPANGYVNISSLFGGNVVSELFMEHSFIRFLVDNGGPEKTWQMNLSGEFSVPGDIIPQSNGTAKLGNATNQWGELWVAGNTVYIDSVPIAIGAGNVLTVAGEPVLSNDSNATITTTGNITANYFIGDGSQLTNLPGGDYGNANVAAYLPTYGGNILVDRVTGNTANNLGYLQWQGNSSGDNNGYTTLQLVPDATLFDNDQYLIIDPTEPQHIHIRAGGNIDDSAAELYLGGELNYVRVIDDTGVRLQNRTRNDTFYSFVAPADFNTATWFGTPGNYFVQYTAVSPEIGDLAFTFGDDDENRVTVTLENEETWTLTYGGSSSNLGGGVYRFAVVEAPPASPSAITAMDFQIWTSETNSVTLSNNDFSVDVTDDLRMTGSDVFSLRNRSPNNDIEIRTDYENNDYLWSFGANGVLEAPGDIIVNGDVTGRSGVDTLVLKARPDSDTALQLNDDVTSEIRTVANLEIRTDVGNTARVWTFGTTGTFTTAGDISAPTGNISAGNITIDGNITATRLQNDANLAIRSNAAGTAKNWTFDTLGDFNLPVGGNITGSGGISANNITLTGNITAENFIGNISITGNVTGTSANVQLVAGSYTWTFDNTGNVDAPGDIVAGNIGLSGSITSVISVTDPSDFDNLTPIAGGRAFVTNANLAAAGNFGAQVSGGGANTVPVWSDGTNWYIG